MKLNWKTEGKRSGLIVNDTEIAYISHPGRYEDIDAYICCMRAGSSIINRRLTSNNLEDAKKELIDFIIKKYGEQITVWKECIICYEERIDILKTATE